VWEQHRQRHEKPQLAAAFWRHRHQFIYVILLMTAFNFFSHGTQDLYPTFLQGKPGFTTHIVSAVLIVMNLGAIVGGITFGYYSQVIGRRRAIVIGALLALPIIPLWAFSTTPLMLGLGAFLIQVAVQGAWGVIPAHLNELSPGELRGTFPGLAYQLGNLLAASNATVQTVIAKSQGGNYGLALSLVVAFASLSIAGFALRGREARETVFGSPPSPNGAPEPEPRATP